ncbi:MAG: phosphate signaling complex protein PhoU [Chloroflexi bacterium]|nr:phosphate signaling complex protein PhoU [Chloroflexota bacterium]
MTRETLEKAINQMLDEVVTLGSLVEQAILQAVDSLKERDFEASREIYKADREINRRRYELEESVISLIALHQPVAIDVRVLTAALEIFTELERMGDYAKGIARINLLIGEEKLIKPLIDIPRMAEVTADMLHRALRAFVERDEVAARAIPGEDDRVDELYNQVYRELLTLMFSDPKKIDQANYLLWAAHNLERVADRVTNICERTIYVTTGELVEFDRSDDELETKSGGPG